MKYLKLILILLTLTVCSFDTYAKQYPIHGGDNGGCGGGESSNIKPCGTGMG